MRIAVVDYYHPTLEFKDSCQITIGLGEAGEDSFMIPLDRTDLRQGAPFTIVAADPRSDAFWAHADVDVVLFFSRLDPRNTPLLERIKAYGKKLIVKADSDGTLGYPLVPNYLRTLSFFKDPIGWILRNAKWRMPIAKFVTEKIEQIRLADAVVIESPEALSNAAHVLDYWGYKNLVGKLNFVPNPVAPDVLRSPPRHKENVVVASGRWEDEGVKNTKVLVRVLADFLRKRPDYKSVIIGTGADHVNQLTQSLTQSVRARMEIRGFVERPEVAEILSVARIFFMPSRIESFGIAAAEALCMGCSVVVTPIESLKYLSAHGFSGTVAREYGAGPILSALNEDVSKWEREEYDPSRLAEYWRPKLDRKEIANAILRIAKGIKRT